MAIKVPRYTDVELPQNQRRSNIKIDSGTIAQMNAADTIGGISVMTQLTNQYREVKAEGLASDKFNKWTEQMNAYDTELKSKSGSEAVGSIDKFSEKSNQVIGEFDFSNNFEQSSFEDKVGIAKQAYDKSLLKHQATEAVSFNKLQQDGVMSSSLEGMVKASYTGDVATIDSNTVLYAQAFRAKHKGAPENWVAENIIKNISDGLSNSLVVFSQSNPAGALKAAKHLRHLDGEGSGRISEQQYRYVLQTAKKSYQETISTQYVNNAFQADAVKFKTIGEISGDEDNKSKSSVPRSWSEVKKLAKKSLADIKVTEDPYYGDISDEMKSSMNDRFDVIVKKMDATQEAAINNIFDTGSEAIYQSKINGVVTDSQQAVIDESVLALKGIGEYEKASNLKDLFETNRPTNEIKYAEANTEIDTGQLTSISQLTHKYGKDFNSEDFNSLKKRIRTAESSKVQKDSADALAIINSMLPKKDDTKSNIIENQKKRGATLKIFNKLYAEASSSGTPSFADVTNMASSAYWQANRRAITGGAVDTYYDSVEDAYESFKDYGYAEFTFQSEKDKIRDLTDSSYIKLRNMKGVIPTEEEVVADVKSFLIKDKADKKILLEKYQIKDKVIENLLLEE